MADLLKPLGYMTFQNGKNHLGDRNEFLPTVHGFDEFFGNLYHLNAEQEPENVDYPKNPAFLAKFGPRGVLEMQGNDDGKFRGSRSTIRRVGQTDLRGYWPAYDPTDERRRTKSFWRPRSKTWIVR